MSRSAILVVTGASATGKTAAVQMIQARDRPGIRCFYFDSIGVPSLEVMHREFGGPEGWQADATKRWIAQLAADSAGGSVSVLDGQTRPSFVRAALASTVAADARVVLLDCSSDVRQTTLGCSRPS